MLFLAQVLGCICVFVIENSSIPDNRHLLSDTRVLVESSCLPRWIVYIVHVESILFMNVYKTFLKKVLNTFLGDFFQIYTFFFIYLQCQYKVNHFHSILKGPIFTLYWFLVSKCFLCKEFWLIFKMKLDAQKYL